MRKQWGWHTRYRGHKEEEPIYISKFLKERKVPTATDYHRNLMEKWFNDSIDLRGPLSFLKSHGYTEYAGMIVKPTLTHNISRDEWKCIVFLCDEWDFAFDQEKW